MVRIAICHPTDPFGHVPGGIDSFIKGILRWAPDDLDYTLIGATSDVRLRPVMRPARVSSGAAGRVDFVPIVRMQPSSSRGKVPLAVRYMLALTRLVQQGELNSFDILDFHRIEPALLFGQDVRRKNLTLHADSSVLRDKNCDIMWRHWPWLYERLEAKVFRHVDSVFAVRRSAVARYSQAFPGLAEKFSFIPTWMDTETFHPANCMAERHDLRTRLVNSFGISHASRLLVFVGRLDYQKDPLLLLRALQEAQRRQGNLHLLVIGDGILRSEVVAACERLHLQGCVSLLGVRNASEIGDILKASDLFVLSSAYEGMSIAVLEALATGVPVVSTPVGEIDLVLKNGVNGQISRDRSPGALADAIDTAINRLDAMSGGPCVDAVQPFRPDRVLTRIYENHRRQSAEKF